METTEPNWKRNFLIIGGIIGALTGLGAAYLMIRQAEDEGGRPKLKASDGIQMGMSVMTLMRQIGKQGHGR
ncbi:MAG: hypothetical protein JXA97_09425 [Anaerolineales bacterium]|nr:hypothetical protein [Anaerolineales bacterium]